MKRLLIGYSTCQFTREAFERHGIEVWTCDLRADPHPQHLQCDIWEVAEDNWDAGIFHPTCTYLTCSAAWACMDPNYDKYPSVGYHQKVKPGTPVGAERRGLQMEAINNFKRLFNLPYRKAIENPSPSMVSGAFRPADQTIQPYNFGEDASKGTGLWLDRLPPLKPTQRFKGRIVEWPHGSGNMVERWSNQTNAGQNKLTPGEGRWLERSRTYKGIADAFGDQWSSWL